MTTSQTGVLQKPVTYILRLSSRILCRIHKRTEEPEDTRWHFSCTEPIEDQDPHTPLYVSGEHQLDFGPYVVSVESDVVSVGIVWCLDILSFICEHQGHVTWKLIKQYIIVSSISTNYVNVT